MDRARPHVGAGLYPIPEAARILGVSAAKVHRWVCGREALLRRAYDPAEKTLSFLELMELHFVKLFRAEGVSMQTIRRAAEVASHKFHTDYPFAVKRFDTDGRTIFATLERETGIQSADQVLIEDLRKGQYVFERIMRPFFRKLEYGGGGDVMRYWPLEPSGRVVLDPGRKFGKPIDAETGVSTRAIFDAVMAGGGQDEPTVAKWLDLPLQAVRCAVRFERSLAMSP